MLNYHGIDNALMRMSHAPAESLFDKEIIPILLDEWVNDYTQSTPDAELVETSVENFSYLFDVAAERLIAAWGISRGRHGGKRDAARMAGHPLSAGKRYHRGHAIAHTLGGGTDINLVAQRGAVNIGPFRLLEREAVNTPGALYFSYWLYGASKTQKPIGVQQGLLCPGRPATLRTHRN